MPKYPPLSQSWFVSVLGPLALVLFIITFLVALTRLDASDSSPVVVQTYETPHIAPAEPLAERLSRELLELERRLQQRQQQIEQARVVIAPAAPRQ